MTSDLFAREALAQIPKILTLQDRNAHSPTYGCFDRNFWHYKIIDFPSGMAAEFVWPLALAYSLKIEGNTFYQKPALRQWGAAAISYAARVRIPTVRATIIFRSRRQPARRPSPCLRPWRRT